MAEPRVDPDLVMDEVPMLAAFLDWLRATVFQKCEGLTGEQMKEASVPPSTLTVLGIVRHLSECDIGHLDLLRERIDGATGD